MSIEEQLKSVGAFKADRLADELKGPSHGYDPTHRGFEWALIQLRNGHKVQRAGWNGKNMYIVLQEGYPEGIPINANTARATDLPQGTVCRFSPYVMMKTAAREITFVPWLCSQTDLLALDWGYYFPMPTTGLRREVVD